MASEKLETKDLKGWLQRSFTLEHADLHSVIDSFLDIIKNHGFKIRKKVDSQDGLGVEAIYGSKIIALLVHFIPFLGKHLPWGKRLGMKASVVENSSINVNISVSPYMELLNTSEVLVLSQSVDEKATDEYFAAHKIHSITKTLFFELNLPVPEEFSKFDTKAFASDVLLGLLIYPLDGYKSAKKIHIPSEKGPKWNWLAFIIPEVWFIWHEIWGVSILAIFLELYGIGKLASIGTPLSLLVIIFFGIRAILGRLGNIIYYYRYGRWHKK